MGRNWKDEDITKAIQEMAKTSAKAVSYDHVWYKIEDKLAARKNGVWNNLTWKPWGHPVRWVMAAACLCLALTGVFYHEDNVEQSELASYVISVSDPTANVSQDSGMLRVSSLLSDPSSTDADMTVDDSLDSIAADEVLL
jgi:hypothetical protein